MYIEKSDKKLEMTNAQFEECTALCKSFISNYISLSEQSYWSNLCERVADWYTQYLHDITLKVRGHSNIRSVGFDRIEIQLESGVIIPVDCDNGYWDYKEDGTYTVNILLVSMPENTFVSVDDLINGKIHSIRLVSACSVNNSVFTIDELHICKDDSVIGSMKNLKILRMTH